MKKLFEIPIYALSPVELSRRANQKITTLEEQFARTDEETRMRIIDRETFPMRNWDYNHVIGYVQLSLTQQEIVAAVFMPVPSPARYYWDSERKFFVRNLFANGMHVYIGDMKTNNEIRDAMTELLEQAIKDHLHDRFYADRATFDTLNGHIDYLNLLQEL